MTIQSQLNSLEVDDLETKNGIQALINKLESIKYNPNKHELNAVKACAQYLASIEVFSTFQKIKGVYYNYDKKMWYAEKMTKGKLKVIKYSVDRNVVISAYKEYIKNNVA